MGGGVLQASDIGMLHLTSLSFVGVTVTPSGFTRRKSALLGVTLRNRYAEWRKSA